MAETTIEWTVTIRADGSKAPGYTFNPFVGCTKVSPACDNCYAESWAKRAGTPELWKGERRRTSASNWRQPIKWNREAAAAGERRKVFCASLADVFDNQVPTIWRDDMWHLIDQTPNLYWLLLTKRPQNIAKMLPTEAIGVPAWGEGWPNVWLGTTVENQAEADRRIPHLLAVPAAVRFLSCEPLLESFDIAWSLARSRMEIAAGFLKRGRFSPGLETLRAIDWVIAGGESGGNARPSHPDWFRSLRDQCAAAGVPFFFKQWGEFTDEYDIPSETREHLEVLGLTSNGCGRVGKKRAGRLLDGIEHSGFPVARQ